MDQNYTLGRGEIYFAKFLPDTTTPGGERYIGNTPECSLTVAEETLDHFSSDFGVGEKDDSVQTQVNRTGKLTTDSVQPANLALFFLGSSATLAQSSLTAQSETFTGVEQGLFYQVGISDTHPTGYRKLNTVVVKDDATPTPATFTVNTDYKIDLETGRIEIVEGGGIAGGTNLVVTFGVSASSREQIVSGATAIRGALRYVARNPKGKNIDYYMPNVLLSPDGDFALKGSEWQTIPFNLEILKTAGREAIYADGRAFTP